MSHRDDSAASRREIIRRGAMGGVALAWVTPVVRSIQPNLAAAGSPAPPTSTTPPTSET
jgi:hypothetical protein